VAEGFLCVLDDVPPPYAEVVAGALRAAGIEAHVLSSFLGGHAPSRARVLVPGALIGEAREVIAQIEGED
jgi:hypothetical protein